MLTSLSIENFKSWKSINKMRLAPITGLFGANSSGKTGILQSLLLMKQSVEQQDLKQIMNFGDDRSPVQLGSFRDVIFGHTAQGKMSFAFAARRGELGRIFNSLIWALGGVKGEIPRTSDDFEVSSTLSESESGIVGVDDITYNVFQFRFRSKKSEVQPGKYVLSFTMPGPNLSQFDSEIDGHAAQKKFYLLPEELDPIDNSPAAKHRNRLRELCKSSMEDIFQRIHYIGPIRRPPERTYQWRGIASDSVGYGGENAIQVLLTDRNSGDKTPAAAGQSPQELAERVSAWLARLGLTHLLELKPISAGGDIFEVHVKLAPDSADVLLPDVGFGVSQVLPIVVLCCSATAGSTIILEQPEIHLHPAAQSALADLFIEAANRDVQIIFESHSEHLLRRLQRRVAEEKIKPDQTAIYFCQRGGVDGSQLVTLEIDLFGNIKNWPKDFFGDEFGEMAAMTKAAMDRKQERKE